MARPARTWVGTKSSRHPSSPTDSFSSKAPDNALWRVSLDGTEGDHLHGYNTSSTPFVVQPENQPQTGTVRPRYQVLTLVYAPPGTNGGKSTSSVDYGSGSTTSTTTSASSSFKAGIDVSASAGGNVGTIWIGSSGSMARP